MRIIVLRTAHIPLSGESAATRTVSIMDPEASSKIAAAIAAIAGETGQHRPLTVVCVGTDRSTGDSLGPLVGTLLLWNAFEGEVMGDLDNPVHAENLESATSRLHSPRGLVIGVDACLGTRQEVGTVMVRPGPLRPGLGVKKKLAPVGDLYVAGVVNVGGFMEYMVLQNTRLSLVLKMAQIIAAGIIEADRLLRVGHPAASAQGYTGSKPFTLAVPENAALPLPLARESVRSR